MCLLRGFENLNLCEYLYLGVYLNTNLRNIDARYKEFEMFHDYSNQSAMRAKYYKIKRTFLRAITTVKNWELGEDTHLEISCQKFKKNNSTYRLTWARSRLKPASNNWRTSSKYPRFSYRLIKPGSSSCNPEKVSLCYKKRTKTDTNGMHDDVKTANLS